MELISQRRLASHIHKKINIDIKILTKHDQSIKKCTKIRIRFPLWIASMEISFFFLWSHSPLLPWSLGWWIWWRGSSVDGWMKNGWRWWWKMEEMVCEVCVEGVEIGFFYKIWMEGYLYPFGPSRRILIFFWSKTRHESCGATRPWGARVAWTDAPARPSLTGPCWLHGSCAATRVELRNTAKWWSCWMNRCCYTTILDRPVLATRVVHCDTARATDTASRVAAALIPSLFWLVLPRFNSKLRSAFSYIFLIIFSIK